MTGAEELRTATRQASAEGLSPKDNLSVEKGIVRSGSCTRQSAMRLQTELTRVRASKNKVNRRQVSSLQILSDAQFSWEFHERIVIDWLIRLNYHRGINLSGQ